jgi:glycosyltransferase involved in cell wall biosynthesis
MKNVTILALHLGVGGIESCIVKVANLLSKTCQVTIVVTYKTIDVIPYPLDSHVKVIYLTDLKPNREEFKDALKHFNLIKTFKEGLKSIKILYLKKVTMINYLKSDNSDVTISSRIYFNNLLGKYGKGIKIGWEHNHHQGDSKYIKSFLNSCLKLDKVVLVSQELTTFYQQEFKNKNIACQCVYIPNFIEKLPSKINSLNNLNIIAVGRLETIKGFKDLINIFYLINQDLPQTTLTIAGDGTLKAALTIEITNLKLTSKVKLVGNLNSSELAHYYQKSSLYLMTSYSESFGLVLIEAMSYGIPCLAFTTAEGAKEIIKDGYNGYLIDKRNSQIMQEKVTYLFKNQEFLQQMGKQARLTAENYTSKKVEASWQKIIGD